MISIKESNMIFGDFEDDKVFKIENSKLQKNLGDGVKTVEFILIKKQNELNFVETKSSSLIKK